MGIIDGIILGIVQGLTEFLPVSSTGHLEVAQSLLHIGGTNNISLDLFLHLCTVIAVIVYFWKDVVGILKGAIAPSQPAERAKSLHIIWVIAISIFATGVVYIIFKKSLEDSFGSVRLIGGQFIFTAIILALISMKKEGSLTEYDITWVHAVIIGVAQGIAIVPGISRSATTICAALFIGLAAEKAFRFSFLLSIPTIIIAWVFDIISEPDALSDLGAPLPLILGSIAGFCFALVAIHLVKSAVLKHKLWYFSIYLVIVGVLSIIFGASNA